MDPDGEFEQKIGERIITQIIKMTDGMNEEDFQAVLNDEKEYEKLEKAAEDAQIENIMYKWEHVDIATPNQ